MRAASAIVSARTWVGRAQRLLQADLAPPLVDADDHRVDDGETADQERHHAAGSHDEGEAQH